MKQDGLMVTLDKCKYLCLADPDQSIWYCAIIRLDVMPDGCTPEGCHFYVPQERFFPRQIVEKKPRRR